MAAYFGLVPWVVFLPVIGLLLNLLFGRRLGEKGIGLIASLSVGLAFLVSLVLALGLGYNPQPVTIHLADWLVVGSLNVAWNFRVDTLSTTMMLVVSGVGTLIHIYATGYMHSDVRHNGDPGRYRRFFVFFNLFIVAMMILVSADNYLMLFVGWEGVGLCSYLLIGFWFEKGQEGLGNARAAKKAFVINRIGDFGVLVALFFIFWAFGSFNFNDVFNKAAAVSHALPAVTLAITLFLLLGVAGKSAQLPLYVWLPDAMAGPTPVSALIHAATMVTAGVYLIARSSPLFNMMPVAGQTVAWVGALTAFFAATIAVGQSDIKKVLAYSTISQLGFMIAAVGMGAYAAGMFHLVTHSFFKALLFLSAGSVILGMERSSEGQHGEASGHTVQETDPQDMRNMGGLQARMPLTFWVYLAGALALSGIAPLAGFFSKDEILAAAAHTPAIFVLLILAAFLTAFYMGRQIFMVFFGKPRSQPAAQASESPAIITGPLVVLAILSVVGGVINLPGLAWLEQWLSHSVQDILPGEFTWTVALGSLAVALLGLVVAWLVYGRRSLGSPASSDPLELNLNGLFRAVEHKWWVDEAYHAIFVRPYEQLTRFLSQPVDLGVIDGAANGLARLSRGLAQAWSRLENGFVRTYALAIAIGLVLMLGYLVLR
jgi:NADH-quinone oxidoreductase subunit L